MPLFCLKFGPCFGGFNPQRSSGLAGGSILKNGNKLVVLRKLDHFWYKEFKCLQIQSSTSLGSQSCWNLHWFLIKRWSHVTWQHLDFEHLESDLRPFLHVPKNTPGGQTWHAQGFAMVFFAKTLGSHDVTWIYWAPGWNSPSWVGCFRRSIFWNAKKISTKRYLQGICLKIIYLNMRVCFKYNFVDGPSLWLKMMNDPQDLFICQYYYPVF